MNYQERLYRMRYGYECEPTTLTVLGLALTATTGALAVTQQRQQAKAQTEFQEKVAIANNKNAELTAGQLREQQSQTNESINREKLKASIAGRGARATAITAAAEGGVSGNSVDALLSDFKLQESTYKESLTRQQQFNNAGVDSNIESVMAGNAAQNTAQNQAVAQPDYLGAALRVGAGSLGYIRDYKRDYTR